MSTHNRVLTLAAPDALKRAGEHGVGPQMTRFTQRLKSLFSGGGDSAGPPVVEDPLDYDQLIHLDAEDLAEQGILSAYRDLLPRLKQYADSPIEVTEDIDNDSARYSVYGAGQRYEIWEHGAKNSDGWERATVTFFAIVNASLSKSSHKFYALYGGNDLSGIFLTPEQCAVARQALKRRSDWPWLPVNEQPHYGYPVENERPRR